MPQGLTPQQWYLLQSMAAWTNQQVPPFEEPTPLPGTDQPAGVGAGGAIPTGPGEPVGTEGFYPTPTPSATPGPTPSPTPSAYPYDPNVYANLPAFPTSTPADTGGPEVITGASPGEVTTWSGGALPQELPAPDLPPVTEPPPSTVGMWSGEAPLGVGGTQLATGQADPTLFYGGPAGEAAPEISTPAGVGTQLATGEPDPTAFYGGYPMSGIEGLAPIGAGTAVAEAADPTMLYGDYPPSDTAGTASGLSLGVTPDLSVGGTLPTEGVNFYPDGTGGYVVYNADWQQIGTMPSGQMQGLPGPVTSDIFGPSSEIAGQPFTEPAPLPGTEIPDTGVAPPAPPDTGGGATTVQGPPVAPTTPPGYTGGPAAGPDLAIYGEGSPTSEALGPAIEAAFGPSVTPLTGGIGGSGTGGGIGIGGPGQLVVPGGSPIGPLGGGSSGTVPWNVGANIWGGNAPLSAQDYANLQGFLNYNVSSVGVSSLAGMSYQDYVSMWNNLKAQGTTTVASADGTGGPGSGPISTAIGTGGGHRATQ